MFAAQQLVNLGQECSQQLGTDWFLRRLFADGVDVPAIVDIMPQHFPELLELFPAQYILEPATESLDEWICIRMLHEYHYNARAPDSVACNAVLLPPPEPMT
jgi:hypothetical protein